VGTQLEEGGGSRAPKVMWLAADGDVERAIRVPEHPEPTDLAIDDEGYIFLVGHGHELSGEHVGVNGAVSKITPGGGNMWTKYYGNPSGGVGRFSGLGEGNPALIEDECWGIAADADGSGFVLSCGTEIKGECGIKDYVHSVADQLECSNDPRRTSRALIIKIDDDGQVLWSRVESGETYGGPNAAGVSASAAEYVIATIDGGFAVITDETWTVGIMKFGEVDPDTEMALSRMPPPPLPPKHPDLPPAPPPYIEPKLQNRVMPSFAPATRSRLSCTELGWDFQLEKGDGSACANSKFPATGYESDGITKACYNGRRLEGAAKMCEAIGARLCTKEEAVGGVAESTGCNLDWQWHWTGTECGTAGDGTKKYYLAKTANAKSKCKKSTKVKAVRCCADVYYGPSF